jgi:vesicle-associated membrane protein 7
MSDEKNRHRVPFAFLQEIKDLFTHKYGPELPQRAIAFSLNEEFSRVIMDRMDYYNSAGANVDSLSAVKSQIDSVKENMVQNIEQVLERGEKIELLVDKTDRLNQQAFKFERSSRELKRAMWWRNARWAAFSVVAGGFALYFIASLFCGFDFHRCKGAS